MATDAIAAGLSEALARSRWRMEVTERADGVTIVNDAYNANPESHAGRAGRAGRHDRRGRRPGGFAVLGLMTELGDAAEEFHEEAGRQAAQAGVAGLIVVGDAAAPILTGAKAVPSWSGEMLHVPGPGGGGGRAGGPAAATATSCWSRPRTRSALEAVALALTGERPLRRATAGHGSAADPEPAL